MDVSSVSTFSVGTAGWVDKAVWRPLTERQIATEMVIFDVPILNSYGRRVIGSYNTNCGSIIPDERRPEGRLHDRWLEWDEVDTKDKEMEGADCAICGGVFAVCWHEANVPIG